MFLRQVQRSLSSNVIHPLINSIQCLLRSFYHGLWENELFVTSRNCFTRCFPAVISQAMKIFFHLYPTQHSAKALWLSSIAISACSVQPPPFWHTTPQTAGTLASLIAYLQFFQFCRKTGLWLAGFFFSAACKLLRD